MTPPPPSASPAAPSEPLQEEHKKGDSTPSTLPQPGKASFDVHGWLHRADSMMPRPPAPGTSPIAPPPVPRPDHMRPQVPIPDPIRPSQDKQDSGQLEPTKAMAQNLDALRSVSKAPSDQPSTQRVESLDGPFVWDNGLPPESPVKNADPPIAPAAPRTSTPLPEPGNMTNSNSATLDPAQANQSAEATAARLEIAEESWPAELKPTIIALRDVLPPNVEIGVWLGGTTVGAEGLPLFQIDRRGNRVKMTEDELFSQLYAAGPAQKDTAQRYTAFKEQIQAYVRSHATSPKTESASKADEPPLHPATIAKQLSDTLERARRSGNAGQPDKLTVDSVPAGRSNVASSPQTQEAGAQIQRTLAPLNALRARREAEAAAGQSAESPAPKPVTLAALDAPSPERREVKIEEIAKAPEAVTAASSINAEAAPQASGEAAAVSAEPTAVAPEKKTDFTPKQQAEFQQKVDALAQFLPGLTIAEWPTFTSVDGKRSAHFTLTAQGAELTQEQFNALATDAASKKAYEDFVQFLSAAAEPKKTLLQRLQFWKK